MKQFIILCLTALSIAWSLECQSMTDRDLYKIGQDLYRDTGKNITVTGGIFCGNGLFYRGRLHRIDICTCQVSDSRQKIVIVDGLLWKNEFDEFGLPIKETVAGIETKLTCTELYKECKVLIK